MEVWKKKDLDSTCLFLTVKTGSSFYIDVIIQLTQKTFLIILKVKTDHTLKYSLNKLIKIHKPYANLYLFRSLLIVGTL